MILYGESIKLGLQEEKELKVERGEGTWPERNADFIGEIS